LSKLIVKLNLSKINSTDQQGDRDILTFPFD
jgi:hypothetical protein